MDAIQFIGGIATIVGSMYGMLKFMLRDMKRDVYLLEKQQDEFREELRHINKRFDSFNNRLDRLYKILILRTYKN